MEVRFAVIIFPASLDSCSLVPVAANVAWTARKFCANSDKIEIPFMNIPLL